MHSSLLSLSLLSASAFALPLATRDEAWDYIIVGSGPAGIIVADRLSESGKSTLLLEAGGPSYYITGGRQQPSWLANTNLSRVDVPGLYKSIFDASTDPQDLLCGSAVNAYMGCTVGGSSAVNAGLFFQPPASDFDTYFPDGWKSTDMQAAIQRLKSRQPSDDVTSQDDQFYLQSGYNAALDWIVNGVGVVLGQLLVAVLGVGVDARLAGRVVLLHVNGTFLALAVDVIVVGVGA